MRPTPVGPGGLVARAQSAAAPLVARNDRSLRSRSRPGRRSGPGQRSSVDDHRSRACAPSRTAIAASPAARAESWRTMCRPVCAAAPVYDPAPPSRPPEPEHEPAEAVGVEAHARALEIVHGARAPSAHEDRSRPSVEPPPAGPLGVNQVQLGAVLVPARGRETALRPELAVCASGVPERSATRAPSRAVHKAV